MQIHCENCGAVIPGANINIQEKLAVCPQCGSVFSFADHLTRQTSARKMKPPQSLSVTEKNNTLEIRLRLLTILKPEEHWFTLLCGVGAFVMSGLTVAMFDGLGSILEGVLGVGFGLIALVCLYLLLVILLDQVRITIDDRMIRTKHEPLALGTGNVKRADVVRVDCTAASYNKDNPDNEFVDYNVQVLRHDGHKVTLVTLRRDLAFYVAQVIEDYLHGDELPQDADDLEDEDENLLLQHVEEDAADSSFTSKSEG